MATRKPAVVWQCTLAAAALLLAAAAPDPRLAPLNASSVEGRPFALAGNERQVVIVHYWATWCAPCRIEMPILDAAYKRYHGAGLEILGIALDTGASRAKVRDASSVSFPLARLADTSIKPSQAPGALPETRVYSRDGRLRYIFRAGTEKLDAKTLERILPPLLAER